MALPMTKQPVVTLLEKPAVFGLNNRASVLITATSSFAVKHTGDKNVNRRMVTASEKKTQNILHSP